LKKFLIAIFFIAVCGHSAWAKAKNSQVSAWSGVVAHVSDGDTLWVRPDGGGEALKIRIDGIDAPEICQAWGPESRVALSGYVLHQRVRVMPRAHDKFGRTVASLSVHESDVGEWLVQGGHAWANQFRNYKSRYGVSQAVAQAARRGLFAAPRPQFPSAFRKRHGPCSRHVPGATS
jgi:endonuclease YncB( thermonuclease family)